MARNRRRPGRFNPGMTGLAGNAPLMQSATAPVGPDVNIAGGGIQMAPQGLGANVTGQTGGGGVIDTGLATGQMPGGVAQQGSNVVPINPDINVAGGDPAGDFDPDFRTAPVGGLGAGVADLTREAIQRRARRNNRNMGRKLRASRAAGGGMWDMGLAGGRPDPQYSQSGGGGDQSQLNAAIEQYYANNPDQLPAGQSGAGQDGGVDFNQSELDAKINKYFEDNPDQIPADWGGTGTGDEAGFEGLGDHPYDPGSQGEAGWQQISKFINPVKAGIGSKFARAQNKIAATAKAQNVIANRQSNKIISALRKGFGGAENITRKQQKNIEDFMRGGAMGANVTLQRGEQRALQGLAGATGRGVGVLDPFAQGGLGAQQRALALAGGPGAEDAYANYAESPDQRYLREQGEEAILRKSAATGGLGGGGVQAELQKHAIGLASQNINERIAQQTALAQQGLGAAGQQAGLYGQQGQTGAGITSQMASQQASNVFGTGQALAQSRTQMTNSIAKLSQMSGMAEAGVGQNLMDALMKVRATQGEQSAQALMNEIAAQMDVMKTGVDAVSNWTTAQQGGTPSGSTGGAFANAAASIIAAAIGG